MYSSVAGTIYLCHTTITVDKYTFAFTLILAVRTAVKFWQLLHESIL